LCDGSFPGSPSQPSYSPKTPPHLGFLPLPPKTLAFSLEKNNISLEGGDDVLAPVEVGTRKSSLCRHQSSIPQRHAALKTKPTAAQVAEIVSGLSEVRFSSFSDSAFLKIIIWFAWLMWS
jgi:hypothetical protein